MSATDLCSFLNDKNTQVRLAAAEGISALTSKLNELEQFKGTQVIRLLCRLIGDVDLRVSKAVLSALINLSGDPHFLQEMINAHVVTRLIEGIMDSSNSIIDLYAMLLSNVSRSVEGASKLLQISEPLMGYNISRMIEAFLIPVQLNSNQKFTSDTYAWVAPILNNVTQLKEGRQIILNNSNKYFNTLLSYLDHPNPIRRHGIVGTIRNCLFESQNHQTLLGNTELLSKILLPLRGAETFTAEEIEGMPSTLITASKEKEREKDVEIRSLLLDCLRLLTSTKYGRETMRKKQVFVILKYYDEWESNESLSNNIYQLITILKGLDEGHQEVNINPSEIVQPNTLQDIFAPPENKEQAEEEEEETIYVPKIKKDTDEQGDEIEEI